ncbi:Histidine kinase-, DNA gyrase B-, and HSP90-like ATPase [Pustulibacterium marinum]|uniref:Histidine kinase-, DNA gyrase B-, and HSP90-like ATPase n=1 Tax=Pustulibacterium marinum TaxID=1224947 RepID=A0A1I7IRK1_9FLAO|nr:ATP-binding protein [Pustulibacterium marinum]SFU75481.1 Histidine kinase-, DNA gyrase B-, and HSP90-like ATPase [Pustulibacterium marinum]
MSNIVSASPTKDFFIQMLTKDIKLERAIIDLIDNSIDGAKNLRGDNDFDDLWIKIKIDDSSFSIEDNCGGFSLDVAKNYAFMFGRPEGSGHDVKHSVGRFGVGMKRALFKMGNQFEVESHHQEDHFLVTVDVNAWSKIGGDWSFEYEIIDKNNNDLGDVEGTFIRVTNLTQDVLDEFSSEIFVRNLRDEIERTLSFSLDKQLSIYINDIKLNKSGLSLLQYDELKPFCKTFDVGGVNVKIYAGVGKASPDDAGWYIYCNDRLVLERDKTNLTGWDGRRFGNSNVQKFHHIYAMFRGFVFFSSDNSKLLPMTTTKTGVDSNSKVFKAARNEMINAMSQVITFLKTFNSDEERNDVITSSEEVDIIQLSNQTYDSRFKYPTINKIGEINDSLTTVSFKADKKDVDKSKKFFHVSANREVGEKVFEYFIKSESDNL